MKKLAAAKRVQILSLLCEGSSMRSVSRLADVSINTVSKLLVDAGRVCTAFHDEKVRGLRSKRVQVDEIWSFTYAKEKHVAGAKKAPAGAGDTWTWTAIDADSKLIVSWLVGARDAEYATAFINDVSERVKGRIQLTSDGHRPYVEAVEGAFGADIDYAILQKLYGTDPENEKRYSPAKCIGVECRIVQGDPNPKHISTSYVERSNLTMRMHMRRFTRLTNAFSKKFENHVHMVALYTVFYNWTKVHKTLRTTPAMAAGLTDHVWDGRRGGAHRRSRDAGPRECAHGRLSLTETLPDAGTPRQRQPTCESMHPGSCAIRRHARPFADSPAPPARQFDSACARSSA